MTTESRISQNFTIGDTIGGGDSLIFWGISDEWRWYFPCSNLWEETDWSSGKELQVKLMSEDHFMMQYYFSYALSQSKFMFHFGSSIAGGSLRSMGQVRQEFPSYTGHEGWMA